MRLTVHLASALVARECRDRYREQRLTDLLGADEAAAAPWRMTAGVVRLMA